MRTGEGGVRSTGVEGRPGGLEAAGLGCVLGMRAWDAGRARGACAVHFSLCTCSSGGPRAGGGGEDLWLSGPLSSGRGG